MMIIAWAESIILFFFPSYEYIFVLFFYFTFHLSIRLLVARNILTIFFPHHNRSLPFNFVNQNSRFLFHRRLLGRSVFQFVASSPRSTGWYFNLKRSREWKKNGKIRIDAFEDDFRALCRSLNCRLFRLRFLDFAISSWMMRGVYSRSLYSRDRLVLPIIITGAPTLFTAHCVNNNTLQITSTSPPATTAIIIMIPPVGEHGARIALSLNIHRRRRRRECL